MASLVYERENCDAVSPAQHLQKSSQHVRAVPLHTQTR